MTTAEPRTYHNRMMDRWNESAAVMADEAAMHRTRELLEARAADLEEVAANEPPDSYRHVAAAEWAAKIRAAQDELAHLLSWADCKR